MSWLLFSIKHYSYVFLCFLMGYENPRVRCQRCGVLVPMDRRVIYSHIENCPGEED